MAALAAMLATMAVSTAMAMLVHGGNGGGDGHADECEAGDDVMRR